MTRGGRLSRRSHGYPPALPRALALGCVLFLAVGSATRAVPSPRARWSRIDTPSFTVIGDATPRRLGEVTEELERFRAALARLKPGAAVTPAVPTLVIACDGERSFAPYRALERRDQRDIAGVFHSSPWGSSLAFDAGMPIDRSLAIALHEYVHFFVASAYPSTPLWLNEGLAEFYSTFRATRAGVEIGRPLERHVLSLREGWKMPLARLLAVDHQSPEYLESERIGAFYAQSWVLVHYLLIGEPELSRRAPAFLARLDRGESAESAAREGLGVGLADLEVRLRHYVAKPIFRFMTYPIGELTLPTAREAIEVPRDEALALLAEHLAHAGDLDGAAEHLAALTPAAAGGADALALAAYLAERRDRRTEARELYHRATAAQPRRAASWLHAARFALDENDHAGARRAAEGALAIAPELGEGWAVLGSAALTGGDTGTAIAAFTEAERRLPERPDLVYNRFLAFLQHGNLATARALAEGKLARVAGPELATQARQMVAEQMAAERINRAVAEANRAFEAEDPSAAAEALRRARAAATDPEVQAYLDANIAQAEQAVVSRQRVEAYNRAVELVNAGKLEEALAAIAPLLAADCLDEPACEAAHRLAAEIERRRRRR